MQAARYFHEFKVILYLEVCKSKHTVCTCTHEWVSANDEGERSLMLWSEAGFLLSFGIFSLHTPLG
jgi:hypothetical protein